MQEVGPPHGREVERRPEGLQTWERRNQSNAQDNQQTAPKERPRTRVRARARPGTPFHTQTSPPYPFPPVGCYMAPHRCPHCEDVPNNIFSLPPYSIDDPNPHPIMKTYFPLTTPPSLTQTPPCAPSVILTTHPSIPSDPPPPYDSLFPTAAPSDSAVTPPDIWNNPYFTGVWS